MDEAVLTPILDILDIAGIAIFALSGAVIAAKERQTFVTMAFFALVTGVGGGTVRDLLIDAPVFWITDPWVAAVCLLTALIAWFTPVRLWQGKLFDFADGAGLAAYAVLGSAKALAYGIPPVPAVLMGIITGCVGGIIRDVVAGRPSIIMQPELYVTAAALSAAVTVTGMTAAPLIAPSLVIADGWIWGAAFLAGMALRAAAIQWQWGLPSYGRKKGADEPPLAPPSKEKS
ncbi:trimeric intracellular cation channel family protein [Erythrobacter rubeus]|uniref:Trimeric intracellular cation channel family protein n=1 Tax=Erythrobacter rubeus TaxID=2760803 RepID=A0ABR8KLU8_9SPHN|nr:trimeric intracellular cation channel family protein [Erythrobacter rubeus]MBD2841449.1 trimeric intracellular cation channel family protein [Erythrobacter rubeus]